MSPNWLNAVLLNAVFGHPAQSVGIVAPCDHRAPVHSVELNWLFFVGAIGLEPMTCWL